MSFSEPFLEMLAATLSDEDVSVLLAYRNAGREDSYEPQDDYPNLTEKDKANLEEAAGILKEYGMESFSPYQLDELSDLNSSKDYFMSGDLIDAIAIGNNNMLELVEDTEELIEKRDMQQMHQDAIKYLFNIMY